MLEEDQHPESFYNLAIDKLLIYNLSAINF